jgi:hypothetical protein
LITSKNNLNKRLTAFFALACLASIAGISTEASAREKPKENQKETQTNTSSDVEKHLYSDSENGYSIEFPANWKTKKDMIVSLVAAPSETFKMPNPIPNIKIVVKSIPDGHTLDTISDTAVRQWGAIWKVESDEHSKAGKTPTRRLVLVQSIPISVDTSGPVIQRTKVLKAFAVSKDNYYIISCSAYTDNFEKSRQMFNDVIDSLTLAKP